MKTFRFRLVASFRVAATVAVCASLAGTPCALAEVAPAPFAKACQERLPTVQENYRACMVGIVTGVDTVNVLVATDPGIVGKTVRVFSTAVVEGALRPLSGLADLKDRIVVIGGFLSGGALYSAKVL